MNSNEFIESIKIGVEKETFDELHSLLENSPGRSPRKELVGLSDWYKSWIFLTKKICMNNQTRCKTFGFRNAVRN